MAVKTKKERLTKDEIRRRKEHAFLLYTRDKITVQKELALRSGISEKTIGNWIKDDNWEKYLLNIPLTREEQMVNLLNELKEFNASIKKKPEGARFANSSEADARRKLVRDIKDLETKALLPEVMASLKGLINFVRPESFDDARVITKWADIYIKTLLK